MAASCCKLVSRCAHFETRDEEAQIYKSKLMQNMKSKLLPKLKGRFLLYPRKILKPTRKLKAKVAPKACPMPKKKRAAPDDAPADTDAPPITIDLVAEEDAPSAPATTDDPPQADRLRPCPPLAPPAERLLSYRDNVKKGMTETQRNWLDELRQRIASKSDPSSSSSGP